METTSENLNEKYNSKTSNLLNPSLSDYAIHYDSNNSVAANSPYYTLKSNYQLGSMSNSSIYNTNYKTYISHGYSTDDSNVDKLISYTKLDGCEEVVFIKQCNIMKMTRRHKFQFKFSKTFPFIKISDVMFTDVSYLNSKDNKTIEHIFAIESPTLMAKKFGLEYEKTSNIDLVNDDLDAN